MKTLNKQFLFALFLLFTISLFGQNKLTDDDCINAPISSLCAINGFESNSAGYTNDLFVQTLGFCGPGTGTHNNSWIGFIAQNETVEFLVSTSNCSGTGTQNGLQFAIVETDCDVSFNSLACIGTAGEGALINDSALLATNTLVPGNEYYILVDGFASGICDYKIELISDCNTIIANAGPDTTLQCNLLEVTLGTDSTSMGPEFVYEWDYFGNIVGTEPFLTVTNSGQYILKVTNSTSNEMASDTVNVSVTFEFIGLSITGIDQLTCDNPSTSLEVFTELFFFTETETLWTTNDGNIISDPTQNTVEVNQAGTYTVVVTNLESGCTGMATYQVSNSLDIPNTIIASPEVLSCLVSSVILDGSTSSAGPNFTYSWNGPSGFSSDQINPQVIECGVYDLIVTNTENGCTSSASVVVQCDNNLPSISISTPDILEPGGIIQLSGTVNSIEENFTFIWTTTNGNILAGENTLTPTIDAPGEYCLIVVNLENGCEVIECVIVELSTSNTPIADVGPDIRITCNGTTIDLCFGGEDTSQGPEFSYEWVNSTGEVISTDRVFKAVDESILSDLPLTLIVTNNSTGEQAMDTQQYLNDSAVPTVLVYSPGFFTCIDSILEITSTTQMPDEAYVYLWYTADGNIISNPNLQEIFIDLPGEYSLTVTDTTNGCSSFSTIVVGEILPIIIDANAGAPNIITCDTTQLLDPSIIISGLMLDTCIGEWRMQEGLTLGEFPTAIVNQIGIYTYLKKDPINGCTTHEIQFNVQIEELPIIDLGPDISLNCLLLPIIIEPVSISNGGNYSYSWTSVDGVIISNTPELTVNSPGTFTLTVTDLETGCQASDEIVVTQSGEPLLIFAELTDVSCFGANDGSVTLTVSGGVPPYTYSFPSGLNQENLSAGSYTFEVIDADQCGASTTVNINEPELLILDFVITAGQLEAEVMGGVSPYTYDWNVGVDSSVIVDPVNGTEYSVTITDANGCTQEGNYIYVIDAVFSPSVKQLIIYPNPADELITISTQDLQYDEISTLKILDIHGRDMQVKEFTSKQDGAQVDISRLHAGAYILHLVIGDELYVQKLIVL